MATKTCPYCGETIQEKAKKCRFCGEWLETPQETQPAEPATPAPRTVQPPVAPPQPVPQYEQPIPPYTAPLYEYPEPEERVGFFDAYFKDPYLKHYADFGGYTGRKQFWLTVVASIIVGMGVSGVALIIASLCGPVGLVVAYAILGLFNLALVIPQLALMARRLRDAGKNPWLLLLVLIPFIGSIILLIFFVSPSDEDRPQPNVKFGGADIGITIGSVVVYIAGMVLALTIGLSSILGLDLGEDYDSTDLPDMVEEEVEEVVPSAYAEMEIPSVKEEIAYTAATWPESASGSYTGNIGKYNIRLEMKVNDDGEITGRYQYSTSGNAWLILNGEISGNDLMLYEHNDDGDLTGCFVCTSTGGGNGVGFRGEFTSYQGKTYTVNLHRR